MSNKKQVFSGIVVGGCIFWFVGHLEWPLFHEELKSGSDRRLFAGDIPSRPTDQDNVDGEGSLGTESCSRQIQQEFVTRVRDWILQDLISASYGRKENVFSPLKTVARPTQEGASIQRLLQILKTDKSRTKGPFSSWFRSHNRLF